MQNRITEKIDLLNEKGEITEEGYATDLLWKYDRTKIKASWLRIKEWDYYYILTEEFGLTLTVADLGYIGFAAIAFLDFKTKNVEQMDTMTLFPKGKLGLSSSSKEGDIEFKDKKINIKFIVKKNKRYLYLDSPKFNKVGINAEVELDDLQDESMVIATSWKENRKKFYYNQKVNCYPASGKVVYGEKEFNFKKDKSFAGLDWGRGNWTYKNRWYWASASGIQNGVRIGWNLGYGFTDRSPASENMLFYDGKAHKLEEVIFEFEEYMDIWKFTSSDGRFEMKFKPAIDRKSKTNLLIIKSEQHQVFGYYSGYFILDNGSKIEVNEFLGFAEDVLNWW
ncbi:MAG: DUF2804 domain-containing protein [Candidatus Kariarchaeaceae archaeon]